MTAFLKRHFLWAGFVAALVPVGVLLALQFVWLSRLERMSAMAQQAVLHNYLEGVGTEVQYAYRAAAERVLNVPAAAVMQGDHEQVAYHWKKKSFAGARRMFLVDYTRDPFGNLFLYEPEYGELLPAPASDESLAIIVACTPWQITAYRKLPFSPTGVSVDERDPEHRILANPIVDDATSSIVAVVGMVLDEDYFRGDLLPKAIENGLKKFFPDAAERDVEVTVRDGRKRLVLGSEPAGHAETEVNRAFPFVYTDWTLELRRRGEMPGRWARASFASNMALAALLALLLTGGVALALRAAGRAMRLSEMKSDFVSNVSHELRTPLASIRMFAEMLSLGRAPTLDKAKEYGEYIDAESRRLSRLIDNILDFARIESGRKTYQLARADLTEVVAAVVRTFEVRLRPAGFTVRFAPPASPLPLLDLDPDAIGQALHNLLDNAVKYSGEARAIDVSVSQDDTEAVVAVRDHGIGIPRHEQARVFERFHRVPTGLVHDVKGSGLGLAIVRHIVEAHGGRLHLVSAPGEGSTFTLRLPLRPAADLETERVADLRHDVSSQT